MKLQLYFSHNFISLLFFFSYDNNGHVFFVLTAFFMKTMTMLSLCCISFYLVFLDPYFSKISNCNNFVSSINLYLWVDRSKVQIKAMAFVLPHLLFLLFLLLPFSVIAQTNGNISVGRTLTAGAESAWWLSPSNDFALGFQKLDNDHFLLAIWCHKIPQKTIVWYANEGNPAPRKSKVELSDQGLLLRPPQGDQQLLT